MNVNKKALICLPFVVADEKPHVFITIGFFSHTTQLIKCKIANDKHFIWRLTVVGSVAANLGESIDLAEIFFYAFTLLSSDTKIVYVDKDDVWNPLALLLMFEIDIRTFRNKPNCQQRAYGSNEERAEVQNQNIGFF